ncbi:MAG: NAD-dependent epimerase/dehydratase family protein [Myxococcales bacterium]|nr:NAD-dependent epimerase/dehydratase family protein [Myxococcales bacterium]
MVDILVTGAAGFVGGALRRRLESTGRAAAGLDLRGAVAFTADITDPQALTEAFRAAAPRVVVHAAARVDDRGTEAEFWRVNVEGTRHALAAARAVGVQRFV